MRRFGFLTLEEAFICHVAVIVRFQKPQKDIQEYAFLACTNVVPVVLYIYCLELYLIEILERDKSTSTITQDQVSDISEVWKAGMTRGCVQCPRATSLDHVHRQHMGDVEDAVLSVSQMEVVFDGGIYVLCVLNELQAGYVEPPNRVFNAISHCIGHVVGISWNSREGKLDYNYYIVYLEIFSTSNFPGGVGVHSSSLVKKNE